MRSPAAKKKDATRQRAYYQEHREEISVRKKLRYKKTPEKYRCSEATREKQKARYAAHREEIKIQMRNYYSSHRTEAKDRILLRSYGLSRDAYDALFHRQGGACAICNDKNWDKKVPHVDHDHATGRIRGLLCMKCNVALGLIGDNPKIIQNIVRYLGMMGE